MTEPIDPAMRRKFLFGTGSAAMAAALGGPVIFAEHLPDGLDPVGLHPQDPVDLVGKSGLRVLNDRPINAETPAHFLDDDVTPAQRLFVRNNGHPPRTTSTNDHQQPTTTINQRQPTVATNTPRQPTANRINQQ